MKSLIGILKTSPFEYIDVVGPKANIMLSYLCYATIFEQVGSLIILVLVNVQQRGKTLCETFCENRVTVHPKS